MREKIVNLLKGCATDLPSDVESALKASCKKERGIGREALETVLENVKLARTLKLPMCQDTGTPIFYVSTPPKTNRENIRREIVGAVREATKEIPLRPNAIDPVSGRNTRDNVGENTPSIHFSEWDRDKIRIELMLKGGGSENLTQLYRLPDQGLNANRDLEGVTRCVLDAVHKAQGKGCPPYVIGVGIGGLTDTAISLSKRQLMRKIGEPSRDKELARFERTLMKKINSLGIGPMGFGGKTTALSVNAAKQHRHPASYFVAVSFMCWACRRRSIEVMR